ncbi:MAG: hypothetical protein J6B47_06440 [Prevotella sp.]|nr:hypothetical protein [Prevotella sp.]
MNISVSMKRLTTALLMTVAMLLQSMAQEPMRTDSLMHPGELTHTADSLLQSVSMKNKVKAAKRNKKLKDKVDSLAVGNSVIGKNDSAVVVKIPRDWSTWTPKPQKALWMALVIPGGGQIYNRKYWKLPLVYGGMMGCLYAMTWNNTMYKDYSQAYLDIMDSDPNTQSYNKFLHLGNQINESNIERYKTIFKKRKDKYRRWRDMSFFCLIGVYALSVIDAYVDAELSEFDISKDLSMKVRPAIMHNKGTFTSANPLDNSSVGLQCSLNF